MRHKRKHKGLLSNQDFIKVGSFCFCIWSTLRICGQCHLHLWLWPFQDTSVQLPAADTCISLPGCLPLLMTDCFAALGESMEEARMWQPDDICPHPFHRWIKQGLPFSSSPCLVCNACVCVCVLHRLPQFLQHIYVPIANRSASFYLLHSLSYDENDRNPAVLEGHWCHLWDAQGKTFSVCFFSGLWKCSTLGQASPWWLLSYVRVLHQLETLRTIEVSSNVWGNDLLQHCSNIDNPTSFVIIKLVIGENADFLLQLS